MAKILLIEDDPRLLRMYSKLLQAHGYQVISTTTIHAARDLFERYGRFDLCLSDIEVGLIDAALLLRELNQVRKKFQTPMLIFSAHIEQYQHLCERLDLACLSKSVASAELLDRVAQVIAAYRSTLSDFDQEDDTVSLRPRNFPNN